MPMIPRKNWATKVLNMSEKTGRAYNVIPSGLGMEVTTKKIRGFSGQRFAIGAGQIVSYRDMQQLKRVDVRALLERKSQKKGL